MFLCTLKSNCTQRGDVLTFTLNDNFYSNRKKGQKAKHIKKKKKKANKLR